MMETTLITSDRFHVNQALPERVELFNDLFFISVINFLYTTNFAKWLTRKCFDSWKIFLMVVMFLTSDVDDCVLGVCLNGATCVDGVNKYHCDCKAGYTGIHCETGKDSVLKKKTTVTDLPICSSHNIWNLLNDWYNRRANKRKVTYSLFHYLSRLMKLVFAMNWRSHRRRLATFLSTEYVLNRWFDSFHTCRDI